MTLVELLVVVSIIVLLMAIAVPLMRPTIREGHVREASRQVNVFIAGAKARAAQLGREAGVWIERSAKGSHAARELYLVESPLPYSGDVADDSLAVLQDDPSPALSDSRADRVALDGVKNAFLRTLVNVGDLIQFDFKGPLFRITSISQPAGNGTTIYVYFRPQASSMHPGPDRAWGRAGVDDNSSNGTDDITEAYAAFSDDGPRPPAIGVSVSYQIFRQPTKSNAKPLQLAGGTCIDLENSGMSINGTQFAAQNLLVSGNWILDDKPVVILFHPSGNISRVYYGTNNGSGVSLQEVTPSGTVYLLVGKYAQASLAPPAPATPEVTNLEDDSSFWIAVADRTGAVTVAENDVASVATNGVSGARSFAQTGQSMGGR